MRKQRRDEIRGLKNLGMNAGVYKVRRNVINLIYELKEIVPNLPRIQVRITEDNHKWNGVATMNGCEIWVPCSSAMRSHEQLRRTVYHEVLHAAYGIEHVEGCKLMGPVWNKITKKEAQDLFKYYATAN